MALALTLDSLDGVDEAAQSLYIEKDGKYTLDIDLSGYVAEDEVKGLKDKVEQLLDESKEAKRRAKALEDEKLENERKQQKDKGDFEKLYNGSQEELNKTLEKIASLEKTISDGAIERDTFKVSSSLAAKDSKRAEQIAKNLREFAEYDGESGKVVYKIGGVSVDEKGLSDYATKNWPFLVDGSDATGGGAEGGKGGGATGNKMTSAQFSELSPAQKSEFSVKGGVIED